MTTHIRDNTPPMYDLYIGGVSFSHWLILDYFAFSYTNSTPILYEEA